jgi:hypothetical protein
MFGYITRQASSVATQRRPLRTLSGAATQRSNGGARQAVGLTLVAIGHRVAGELPARPASQTNRDCA